MGSTAGIYALRGDYTNATLSLAATVPFAGWAATGKWAIKANRAFKAAKVTRFISTAEGVVHDLKPTLDRIASGGKFHIEMMVQYLNITKNLYIRLE